MANKRVEDHTKDILEGMPGDQVETYETGDDMPTFRLLSPRTL